MFLKRIEIKGFKSFADKVELELGQGITGVVGPNGSGKSNISDAVRWVLGEQSAKSLRGLKMEDVIFAGTDKRKPLGFAEVSITIDNSDGMLPTEYTEVTVTRRMYRSGESEYYINKNSCRLKDISELFMDTGIGKDGYSIIGQGRIDEILNAKPEDRREIFEEAAGIVKYKTRKIESEKKLDSTQQNIIRLEDIINELEVQIGPLEEQSSKARKYMDLMEKLKSLELNLFIRNVEKIKGKLDQINESSSDYENQLLENNRQNARLEEDYTELKGKLTSFDDTIEKVQGDIYSADNESEKLQGEINVLKEKGINLKNNMLRLDEEDEKAKKAVEGLSSSLNENEERQKSYIELLQGQQGILNDKDQGLQNINSSISEKEKYIEDIKSEIIETLNLIADKKSSINSYNTFKSGIERRVNQINLEMADKEGKKAELKEKIAELESEAGGYQESIDNLKKLIKAQEEEKQYITKKIGLTEKSIFDLNGNIQSKQGRCRVLHEMENEFEGYSRSVKEIMKSRDSTKKFSSGICGVIAELISVPKQYETAIEVALGGALQNIVTEDEYTAKECIEFLKANKYGRATFLPLTTITGKNKGFDLKTISGIRGFVGMADSLVSFDKKYSSIISNLLGRVIVADTIDNAIVFARRLKYSVRIVTLDGDIINPGGAFTGGSVNSKSGRILSRKREIEELEAELTRLKESLDAMNLDKKAFERKIEKLDMELEKVSADKQNDEINLASCANSCNAAKGDMDRLAQSFDSLNKELSQLKEELGEADSKIEAEKQCLSELEDKNTALSEKAQLEQSGIRDILQAKEKISDEITALKVNIAEIRQSASSYRSRIAEIRASIENYNAAAAQRQSERESLKKQGEDIEGKIKSIEDEINALTLKGEDLKQQLSALYDERKKGALIIEEMEGKKKEYGETSASLQNEIHKLEMQKAKLDMELETIQNRIWEDYEISYAGALRYRMDMDNPSQAMKDINSIKENIKELGPVNVSSIDEYKKVKERYEFLCRQKEDLEEARESLNKVIAEMTGKMETQFTRNFGIINKNFNAYFQQLFGGGRAELVLCDESSALTSGIDIIAQPPGKKLQSLTLLSGGEKALTAIGLLFAILKMKPSPFCILDEIEAALDDANIMRFSKFLKELSKNTQFIVVTHRKGTMEITDSLYGVTMEEKGVSRLISARLTEKAS